MKARLPQGVGAGPGNMQSMVKQAQKMQDDMERVRLELEAKEYVETAGGGAVAVSVTGDHRVKSIQIQEEVVDPEDIEMLQDLIIGAINEAMRKVDEESDIEMKKISGGLNIPGLF